jgi:hypothetical protein
MPPIHVAARDDDLDEVQRLVQSGAAGVNDRDDEGDTALHQAVFHDRLRIVKWLVEEGGADVAAKNYGNTALTLAIKNGRLSIVSWLLRKGGASMADTSKFGKTVWDQLERYYEVQYSNSMVKADLYSVLRCFGSPAPTPDAFIASIKGKGDFTPADRDLLLQTERAHAHPLLLRYRAHRLGLLGWERDGGSDCTRILIPDLQNIVLEYLMCGSYLSEEELVAEAVMVEAAAAEEWGRERGIGRRVRQRLE